MFLEAGKELLRVVLLAVLPVLIVSVEKGDVDWKAVGVVGFLAVLRAADKAVHEWGKVSDDPSLTLGITRF